MRYLIADRSSFMTSASLDSSDPTQDRSRHLAVSEQLSRPSGLTRLLNPAHDDADPIRNGNQRR
eukprot:m.55747 g.55747  ORF g.55747 m.55747 type:complete len:64 (+) comp13659_c0_seq5:903-1094(+)